MHDLVRAYVSELSPPEGQAAITRLLWHYLISAHAAAHLLDPHRTGIEAGEPVPGVVAAPITDAATAIGWFTGERRGLVCSVRLAVDTGQDQVAWRLAWTLADFFQRRGHWDDWAATQRLAEQAARRAGDQDGLARVCVNAARALSLSGREFEAVTYLEQAFDLYLEAGNRTGQGHARLGSPSTPKRRGALPKPSRFTTA
jgi:hypothetical protein